MLRPDLPKENVDGEAVEWAVSRLRARPERRKILLVVSDGAPVDDSTLTANPQDYLHRHLVDVINTLVSKGDVALGAIRIGASTPEYYPTSLEVDSPKEIGAALLALLERTVLSCSPVT
jgi:cobaltochelatase CobT